MRILFLSHTDFGSVFRVGSHHLSQALASLGHSVVHVATPVSLLHALRMHPREFVGKWSRTTGLASAEEGLVHGSFRTSLPLGVGAPVVQRALLRRLARRIVRATKMDFDVILADQPLFAGIERYLPYRCLVYRPTDLYPFGAKHRLQSELLSASDGVVATSRQVLIALNLSSALPSLVLENGVDVRHFAVAQSEVRRGSVYVGAFDARFDWEAVRQLAAADPSRPVTLAGPGADRHPPLPENVRLLGPVDYNDLPFLLAEHEVGILPLSDDPLNVGRSPMKFYEYLASGLKVLAKGTPTLSARAGDGVALYESREEIAGLYKRLLCTPWSREDGVSQSLSHDWSAKAVELVKFLQILVEDTARQPRP